MANEFKHIVRIANVDVPGEKAISIALTKIKGVGTNLSHAICTASKVKQSAKTGELSDEEITRLNDSVNDPVKAGIPLHMLNRRKDYETGEDKHFITGTLLFTQDNDLKRLKKIKTLRGIRHQRKLPVRGQRTRSNFRRSKGKVVGVAKKKPEAAKKGKK